MTQQPLPARRCLPAARSRELRRPRPPSVCSLPYPLLHRRLDRRSPRVARVGPGSGSPQPALQPALPLHAPPPARQAHVTHAPASLPGPVAFCGRILLRAPLRICPGWSEAEAGLNDSTDDVGGRRKGGGPQARLGALTRALAEMPVVPYLFKCWKQQLLLYPGHHLWHKMQPQQGKEKKEKKIPYCGRKKRMTLNHKRLINGKDTDLIRHDNA
ncbi:uncharacterized protein LOC124242016 [Equus quagga]|uniref:uncharacterized protein LOC124242016 n=1 Tax=Equus quagga TaxID=89248 RepID=UPI001EE195E3|nr:uncharacterized protein LOC124242016 [Equus quagga]